MQKVDDSDGHLGWTKALPKARIHVIPVPGTHFSMISAPHIETLGRSLFEAVRQAGVAKNAISLQGEADLFTIANLSSAGACGAGTHCKKNITASR